MGAGAALVLVGGAAAQAGAGPDGPSLAPRFEPAFVQPEVHRHYGPRSLADGYQRPWYEGGTNYAGQRYERYVSAFLGGDPLFDTFGNSLGRGWMVYEWSQRQPQARGSRLVKRPVSGSLTDQLRRVTSAGNTEWVYSSFFGNLVVAYDQRGDETYRLTVGDRVHASFTPLTVRKPLFNGMRLDYAKDRGGATLLLSRASEPDGINIATAGGEHSNVTHFAAGHGQLHLGEWTQLGLTYANAHNVQTQVPWDEGNLLHGVLTVAQDKKLSKLWVRLQDDSPADRREGAALFTHDIVLTDTSGRDLRGSQIGFRPRVEGGALRGGTLEASGPETILLEYDLAALDHDGVRAEHIRRARVELGLANDYQVWMSSDLQTGGSGFNRQPVFLPFARADGNVGDKSNSGVVAIDYGLPTANELLGADWNVTRWRDLSLQGEVVVNRRYRQYPSAAGSDDHESVDDGVAGYAMARYERLPWTLFAEAFSIGADYTTSYWLTQGDGTIAFGALPQPKFEFVDDDDDENGLPEWERLNQAVADHRADPEAWPGLDENRDFIDDHNQNRNLIPDYEEPFLRYRADRPEFLVGQDMNHNGTVDRFENDDLPDYPYKADHRGINGYAQAHLGPSLSALVGRQRLGLVAGDGRTHSWYGQLTWQQELARGARLRLFEQAALVRDDIADDLRLWLQPVDDVGRMVEVPDRLPSRNTWEQTAYADLDLPLAGGVRSQHRARGSWRWQRDGDAALRQREGRRRSSFVGLIDKVEGSIPVGLATLEPRWKSEVRRERPFSTRLESATRVEQSGLLVWTQPLFAERAGGVSYIPRYGRQIFSSQLQLGLEGSQTWRPEGDFFRWTGVAQLTNRTAFQGYQVVTRGGFRLSRWLFRQRSQTSSLFFLTLNAGLD